ncbi:PilT/PilU family type 4a pilus ATPase [Patescibacteria group bacterium]|nr:PilT/PilU family type 4a pilus ATPase [Patescibacteria group bacterium]
MDIKLKKILEMAVANKATDVHLMVETVPKFRVGGNLMDVTVLEKLGQEEIKMMVDSLLDEEKKKRVSNRGEVDLSFSLAGSRFRVSVYYQQGSLAVAFRVIPIKVPTFEELGLPPIFNNLAEANHGFVLVTGPTGHGKSTTVASVLNQISEKRNCHIVTIEDPIEYLIKGSKSIVSQREVGADTKTFASALKSVLRQDPDVVFVGEMRDLETIGSALTVAETGHLVFSTLHTNSASQAVDRIVDVFPPGAKDQIRLQLASVLTAVISERLVPNREGGLSAAFEILTGTGAVRNSIREGKTYMIDNIIQTSMEVGMVTLETSLARLVKEGKVEEEVALSYSMHPSELMNSLRKVKG